MPLVSHNVLTDIFDLEYIVQQTGMMHGKNILIDFLREIFRQDRQYKFVSDVFGYPLTPSHLGLDPNAGFDTNETTRIYIGSSYRQDVKFNPSIIVKNTSSRYKPISFNQDAKTLIYETTVLTDGYGRHTVIRTPKYHRLVGAWEQNFELKVIAESELDREEITDIVMATIMGTRRIELEKAGLHIKTISSNGETETPYANDYLYSTSITVETRSEWKVNIPVTDICDRIALYVIYNASSTDVPVSEDFNNKFLISLETL